MLVILMNQYRNQESCQHCAMLPFCDIFKEEDFHVKRRTLKKNEILHHTGDRFTQLYAIRHGSLKSQHINYLGSEIIHQFYITNEIYGFEGIYNDYYPYETRAITSTEVCEIPYTELFQQIDLKSHLLKHCLNLMSQQIVAGYYVQYESAQQRVAAFLLDLARRLRVADNEPMLPPMTYEDMANHLNLTPETISRTLSGFKKAGIISMTKKIIHFINTNKLKAISQVI